MDGCGKWCTLMGVEHAIGMAFDSCSGPLGFSPREQVREEAVGAEHAGRQLAEEADPCVHEAALAMVAGDERAVQRLFTGVVPGDRRDIVRVQFAAEVEPRSCTNQQSRSR